MPFSKSHIAKTDIIRAALDAGFSVCGVSAAEAVDESTAEFYLQWIGEGRHASMGYLAENVEKRLDPRLLMPGVKTIVSVALKYGSDENNDSDGKVVETAGYTIAAYALGKDYHDVVKAKLHQMATAIGAVGYRAFCDTAPVLERYWAARSGIGFIGRNGMLIVPKAGSMFFLGELFLMEELEEEQSQTNPENTIPGAKCGICRACFDCCPTKALSAKDSFDARLCLSYHTIENRGEIPSEIAAKMGNCIYGCDRCQNACPHNNKHAILPVEEQRVVVSGEYRCVVCDELRPKPELLSMTCDDWHNLSIDDYRRLFRGSAVKRAKYEGLMRNIELVRTSS